MTTLLANTKKQLDQYLYLSRNDDELDKLEKLISEKKNSLMHLDNLGSSVSSAESLLNSLIQLKCEADGISERCIALAKDQQVRNVLCSLVKTVCIIYYSKFLIV